MDLLPVILAMAQAEGPSSVLGQVVSAVLQQDFVALAQVWFLDDEDCPVCQNQGPMFKGALHLRASDGHPQRAQMDWTRIDGRFHRISLGSKSSLVSNIALTGEAAQMTTLTGDEDFGIEPSWIAQESLHGFIGYPLRFRGKVVGVLTCYLRTSPNESMSNWLQTLAAHAAVAIGNCRSFQEINRLHQQLEMERDYLLEEAGHTGAFEGIVGHAKSLQRLIGQVEMVAPTDANVLIQGESGTGKELIARAIHQRSQRSAKALVKVNCGSIAKDLFESEFFGHVQGAFTGAIRDRVGRFQLADRGTLFLDEVSEIPMDLQVKLLRVLQEGEFERVGDETTRRVNVRILAATNRDLRAEVSTGRFRPDLFYRLSVFPIQVPPLRDRREDIPVLATQFLRQACERLHRGLPNVPQQEMDKLLAYDWPGNIRELQHVIEHSLILASRGPLRFQIAAVPAGKEPEVEKRVRAQTSYYTEKEWRRMERENMLAVLQKTHGKVAGPGGAAELLGVNENTLASRLRALGLRKQYPE
jgi:transcriptional regulator with GAF, ATPase, and Fis domain